MKRTKALLIGLALILALSCLPVTALAYIQIDNLDGPCELTINSKYAGVTYKVYKVCTINKDAIFTPTADFEGISGTINEQIKKASKDAWEDLVTSLTGWLAGKGKNVTPTDTAISGPDNKAVFDDGKLTPGLYLVCGDTLRLSNGYYVPKAFLVTLPGWFRDDETGEEEWRYDVSANGKGDVIEDKDGTTVLQVLKVWDDDDSEDRPTEVTVQLLGRKLGTEDPFTVYGTVTLNSSNNWRHVWENLDKNYEWIIQEVDIPEGYVSSTSRNGVNYVITNESDSETDIPDDPPPLEEFPNLPDIDIPDEDPPLAGPPNENQDDLTNIEDEDVPLASLPQTGMLWWPVPILAVSGMFLFILGWGLHRRQQNDEE